MVIRGVRFFQRQALSWFEILSGAKGESTKIAYQLAQMLDRKNRLRSEE